MKALNKNRTGFGKFFSRTVSTLCCLILLLACSSPVYAADYTNEIMEWDVFKGIKDLIGDATQVCTILLPAIAGLYVVYCLIRRSIASDEGGDAHMWNKKIKTAVICGIAGGVVSGLISLLANYVG